MKNLGKFALAAALLASAALTGCTTDDANAVIDAANTVADGLNAGRRLGCSLDPDCGYYYTTPGKKLDNQKVRNVLAQKPQPVVAPLRDR